MGTEARHEPLRMFMIWLTGSLPPFFMRMRQKITCFTSRLQKELVQKRWPKTPSVSPDLNRRLFLLSNEKIRLSTKILMFQNQRSYFNGEQTPSGTMDSLKHMNI